jgi:hypothetical protein
MAWDEHVGRAWLHQKSHVLMKVAPGTQHVAPLEPKNLTCDFDIEHHSPMVLYY